MVSSPPSSFLSSPPPLSQQPLSPVKEDDDNVPLAQLKRKRAGRSTSCGDESEFEATLSDKSESDGDPTNNDMTDDSAPKDEAGEDFLPNASFGPRRRSQGAALGWTNAHELTSEEKDHQIFLLDGESQRLKRMAKEQDLEIKKLRDRLVELEEELAAEKPPPPPRKHRCQDHKQQQNTRASVDGQQFLKMQQMLSSHDQMFEHVRDKMRRCLDVDMLENLRPNLEKMVDQRRETMAQMLDRKVESEVRRLGDRKDAELDELRGLVRKMRGEVRWLGGKTDDEMDGLRERIRKLEEKGVKAVVNEDERDKEWRHGSPVKGPRPPPALEPQVNWKRR